MRVAQAILTLVMGLLYYSLVAPILTTYLLFIQFMNLELEPKGFIAIWSWPIFLCISPEHFAQGFSVGEEDPGEEEDDEV